MAFDSWANSDVAQPYLAKYGYGSYSGALSGAPKGYDYGGYANTLLDLAGRSTSNPKMQYSFLEAYLDYMNPERQMERDMAMNEYQDSIYARDSEKRNTDIQAALELAGAEDPDLRSMGTSTLRQNYDFGDSVSSGSDSYSDLLRAKMKDRLDSYGEDGDFDPTEYSLLYQMAGASDDELKGYSKPISFSDRLKYYQNRRESPSSFVTDAAVNAVPFGPVINLIRGLGLFTDDEGIRRSRLGLS